MKRFISFVVICVAMLCNVGAQTTGIPTRGGYCLPDSEQLSFSDEIKSFITKMYEGEFYKDYDFLQKHCSAELLKKLRDAYPYDVDGVAYATWLFGSGYQDVKPGSNGGSCILDVKADVDDWYIYSALDMGWRFVKKIKVFCKDGKIVIFDICAIEY